jgi:hypothetical protein
VDKESKCLFGAHLFDVIGLYFGFLFFYAFKNNFHCLESQFFQLNGTAMFVEFKLMVLSYCISDMSIFQVSTIYAELLVFGIVVLQ